jgi:tRNA threonylcarbamoyladenosine biosynthesis protein TsaE
MSQEPVDFAPTDDARELDEPSLQSWGGELGRAAIEADSFVCLYGPLGAGKSTVVRAACRGVGVAGAIPSPTFTLLIRHETPDGRSVWHADLYRLDSPGLLVDAGWPELLEAEGPVFVEWAERAASWLPADRWDVELEFTMQPETRRVSIRAVGEAPPPPWPPEEPC